jgi:hypothetical protein
MKLRLMGCAGNPICLDIQDPSADLFSQVALEDHIVLVMQLTSFFCHNTLMTKLQPNIKKSVTLLYESLPKTATA